MNILIIARADHSGAGYALMQAINKHTEHKCRAISYKRTWLQYPYDILQPSMGEYLNWLKWADVLNVHSDFAVPATSKPVVTTYHGSHYRQHYRELNERDRNHGWRQTCLTIDLSLFGPRWIGRAQEDLSHLWQPAEEFTVVHSPTQPHRKGTDLVRHACAELGVKLDVITKVSHAECLERKAWGHVLVDQVGPAALGYGTSAIEAWAMGMPVISNAPSKVLAQFAKRADMIPFRQSGLVSAIQQMRDDQAFYETWQRYGREWWLEYHSPQSVAQRFVEMYT